MTDKALEGVKVLEFANLVTGPYCSKLLADLGAMVIKIEEPGIGDQARRRGPFPDDIPHPERSGLFLFLNTNKYSITLDPDTQSGMNIFLELVKWADIIIEDKPLREMEKLGLNYESLKKINPKIIMTSITPFGHTGPYKDYKAYNLNTSHGAGAAYIMPVDAKDFDLGPVKGGGFFDDYCNGLSAASGTLVALFSRESTGKGQHIDISKQEASIGFDRVEIGMYANEKYVAKRVRDSMAVTTFKCKDGYALVIAGEDRQWEKLKELIGNPEKANADIFKDRISRQRNNDAMIELLSEWSKDYTKEEVYHKICATGIPAGSLRLQSDLFEKDEQLKARDFFEEIDHPEAGSLKYPSAPYKFSETPWLLERPAPMLGEHNEKVYIDMLGHKKEDIVKMKNAGII